MIKRQQSASLINNGLKMFRNALKHIQYHVPTYATSPGSKDEREEFSLAPAGPSVLNDGRHAPAGAISLRLAPLGLRTIPVRAV